jgi:hypothetical protein
MPTLPRRRFQFSIVLILLLTALIAVLAAWRNTVNETNRLDQESRRRHKDLDTKRTPGVPAAKNNGNRAGSLPNATQGPPLGATHAPP